MTQRVGCLLSVSAPMHQLTSHSYSAWSMCTVPIGPGGGPYACADRDCVEEEGGAGCVRGPLQNLAGVSSRRKFKHHQLEAYMAKNCARKKLLSAVIIALCGTTALTPMSAQADPSLQVLGNTIGEWSAQWWKWAQSIPLSSNPLTDTDGRYCGEGQKGPVWFLGGAWGPLLGQPVSRTCSVPSNRSIFFPISNSIWVNTAWDNPNNTKADMRACAAGIPGNSLGCIGPSSSQAV
jgi:hypothetical protein